ncbi:hypothetical protein PG989_010461 [Apiospora arundinis]
MRQLLPPSDDGDQGSVYDDIYIGAWNEALKTAEDRLERNDHERALQVKSLETFRDELENLLREYPDEQPKKAIKLIYPTLVHYEVFAQNFVTMMSNPVDTSMMWGLLFLVFKLALGSTGPESPLPRINTWLERIGSELSASNDCQENLSEYEKVKKDMVEVNTVIIILWLDIITTFRDRGSEGQGDQVHLPDDAFEALMFTCKAACDTIKEAVRRIERITKLAERQAQKMVQQELMQKLLSLESIRLGGVTLPCHNLPVAENRRFFGRQDILAQVHDHLTPEDNSSGLSSIALHGLGGVGKTQTALAYAYSNLSKLDAVFWVPADTTLSIQREFSHIATDALHIPEARPQAYQENMLRVMNWLQKTSAKWLLIFDNVDQHDVLDGCWPASQHGAVLVTTRDVLVATLPIDRGLEVTEFENEEGANFLLHMATNRRKVGDELDSARKVAKYLGGLPLAINQMAALINARNYSIEAFSLMYEKHDQRLHSQKKNGFKYMGYNHALDTVWDLSFKNLQRDARSCLGILSLLSADSIPVEVFTTAQAGGRPDILSFCDDDIAFGDVLEELTHHGLVRKNIESSTFRIHRLVQSEFRARMDNPQEKFEAAVKILLDKFPPERGNEYNDEEWILYERYIPQVLSLVGNYKESKKQAVPLKADMNFVRLLANAVNAIHDNDTTNEVPDLLETAGLAFRSVPVDEQDKLLWAFLQSLNCMHHLCTSEFIKAENEQEEGLQIRLSNLPSDDILLALSYSWLGMAVGAQGRLEEGLELLLKAGKILEGPAGKIPTRKLVWGYNTSRNYYCMERYQDAEVLLTEALSDAERLKSWYLQTYGHLTFASLRTRMNQLDSAKSHIDKANEILENSSIASRFSWLSSYCAYRAGDVAAKQGRDQDAIVEAEKAVAIGKLTKVPTAILSRCTHAYSKVLAKDPSRSEEAEVQRLEARRLRAQLPNGGGDLDDESDAAFESFVKMDHR